jgi:hypothetical protein
MVGSRKRGDGCDDSMTARPHPAISGFFFCALAPHSRKTASCSRATVPITRSVSGFHSDTCSPGRPAGTVRAVFSRRAPRRAHPSRLPCSGTGRANLPAATSHGWISGSAGEGHSRGKRKTRGHRLGADGDTDPVRRLRLSSDRKASAGALERSRRRKDRPDGLVVQLQCALTREATTPGSHLPEVRSSQFPQAQARRHPASFGKASTRAFPARQGRMPSVVRLPKTVQ